MIINKYFKNIDYNFPRGRGIAVYNTNENLFDLFLRELENSTGLFLTIHKVKSLLTPSQPDAE